jgi:hypothetical protein
VRAQQDGSDYTFTGEVVGFDDGVYIVREGDIVRIKREVSPHNVLDVVSHDPDVRDAERHAELLEDEVRTLQARLAELEEDLRRTKLDAYQVALERDAAVPEWTRAEPLVDGYFWLRHPTGNPTPGIVEILTVAGEQRVWVVGASDGRLLSKLDDGFEWAGPLAAPAAAEQRAAAAKPARPNWQCSGCSWGFDGPLQKTCPCCDREHYWTGSVFAGAVRWDGSRGTCAPEPADVGEP